MKCTHIFVTTGTTQFPELVEAFLEPEIIQTLYKLNCTRLTIQYGQYRDIDSLSLLTVIPQIKVTMFGYRDSIEENIDQADLVISHAGAGTTLQVLRKKKPLIVVVNDKLMNNHQQELADELADNDFVIASCPAKLCQDLTKLADKQFQPFPDRKPQLFGKFLQTLLV